MSDSSSGPELSLREKINLETAQINWLELQTFYARGQVVVVSDNLDLVDVAVKLRDDDSAQFKKWLEEGAVSYVKDEQALQWYKNKKYLWAVVVLPWVLVQDKIA